MASGARHRHRLRGRLRRAGRAGVRDPGAPVPVAVRRGRLRADAAASRRVRLPASGHRPGAGRDRPGRAGAAGLARLAARGPRRSQRRSAGRARRSNRLFEVLPPRIGDRRPATSSPIACCSTSGAAATCRGRATSTSGRATPRRCARSSRRRCRSSPSPPAVDRLRFDGLDFSATPVPLLDGPVRATSSRGCRAARSWRWRCRRSRRARFAPIADAARRRLGAGVPGVAAADFALVARARRLDAGPASPIGAGGARLTLPAGDGVWGHGRSELDLVGGGRHARRSAWAAAIWCARRTAWRWRRGRRTARCCAPSRSRPSTAISSRCRPTRSRPIR